MDEPKIIGIDNRKEYFAAVVRSKPANKPVAIVKPERENPGNAAKPWAIAISMEFFKPIFFLTEIFLEMYSLSNNKKPVIVNKKPTTCGLNTKSPAISLRGYAINTVITVPTIR